jgi:hypothetical protein
VRCGCRPGRAAPLSRRSVLRRQVRRRAVLVTASQLCRVPRRTRRPPRNAKRRPRRTRSVRRPRAHPPDCWIRRTVRCDPGRFRVWHRLVHQAPAYRLLRSYRLVRREGECRRFNPVHQASRGRGHPGGYRLVHQGRTWPRGRQGRRHPGGIPPRPVPGGRLRTVLRRDGPGRRCRRRVGRSRRRSRLGGNPGTRPGQASRTGRPGVRLVAVAAGGPRYVPSFGRSNG